MRRIRVLVVHPHVHGRRRASLALAGLAQFEVVGTAATARIAVSKVSLLNPDVLLLDQESSDPESQAVLAELRRTYPRLASVSIPPLPEGLSPVEASEARYLSRLADELVPRITAVIQWPQEQRTARPAPGPSAASPRVDVLAIGVSTGGPNALATLIPQLPPDLPVPIVIVQHMPPLFTRLLAERLTSQGEIPFVEGIQGTRLQAGKGYIAPGDYHMAVRRGIEGVTLDLHQEPPENSCRPAVDVLFRSVAEAYGPHALGLVLTGMGADGLRGAEAMRSVGGRILAQDEATSVVWGMPGAVTKAGLVEAVLPLEQLAEEIVRQLGRGRVWAGGVRPIPPGGTEKPRATPKVAFDDFSKPATTPKAVPAAVKLESLAVNPSPVVRAEPAVAKPVPASLAPPPVVLAAPVAPVAPKPPPNVLAAPVAPVAPRPAPVVSPSAPVVKPLVPAMPATTPAVAAPSLRPATLAASATAAPRPLVIDGASINAADFDFVSKLVYDRSAIVLEPGKEYLVESRLLAVARKMGAPSVTQLVAKLREDRTGELQKAVIEAMTTNETSFFRDTDPFEALRRVVLPEMIKRRAAQKSIRIWCAASSSGQEPYSIAMIVREMFAGMSDWRVSITSSDISTEMLERCRAGRYSQLEVNRGLPAAFLVKYFDRDGTHWRLKPELRAMVEFFELNLAGPWPTMPAADIVFMRNVLIYFDAPTKSAILGRTRRILQPDGYLFLGGAETTFNLDDSFVRETSDRVSFYRLSR